MACRAIRHACAVEIELSRHAPVAIEAPLHFERGYPPYAWHLLNAAMALLARESPRYMNAVIEVDEVGQSVHTYPLQRDAAHHALSYRCQHRCIREELRVAVHADV